MEWTWSEQTVLFGSASARPVRLVFGEKDVEYYFKRLFLIVSVAALFLLRWFFEGLRRSTCDAQRPEVRLETNQLANCSSNLLERLRRDHLRVQWRGHRASICYV